MKTLLIIPIILSCSLFSQDYRQFKSQQEAGFRGMVWGSSLEEVKQSQDASITWEKLDLDDGSNGYYYKGTVGALNALIAYFFYDNKLFRGKYVFLEDHSNDYSYIIDFKKIGNILKDKYGFTETEEIWMNDLYKDDPDEYGLAVAAGHLMMNHSYEFTNMSINHILIGDNFDISHALEYSDQVISETVEKSGKSKTLSDF